MKVNKFIRDLKASIKETYLEGAEELKAGFTVFVDKDYNLTTYAQTDKDNIMDEAAMLSSGVLVEATRVELAYDLLYLKREMPAKEFDKFISILKQDQDKDLTLVEDALEYVKQYEEDMAKNEAENLVN